MDLYWWWPLGLLAVPFIVALVVVMIALHVALALVLVVALSPLGLLALVAWGAYRWGKRDGAAAAVTPTR